jgi:uncharacterized phage-associated protein
VDAQSVHDSDEAAQASLLFAWLALGLKGEPLLNETVEAWQYGPVVRSLYYEFRDCGANPITRQATDFDLSTMNLIEPEVPPDDTATRQLLDRVWSVYGKLTASQLSQMTHESGSPWQKVWSEANGIRDVDIPNDLIQEYFKSKAAENRARNNAA